MTEPQTGQPADGGGNQPVQGQERTFTQSDIDKMIKERLDRERAKYSDYGELKEQAARWAEYEETQKSELEKAQEAAAKATAAAEKARAEAAETLIQAAFVAEAAKLGAAHPEDAYRLADRSAVALKDGVAQGVAEAVKGLVDAGRIPLSARQQVPALGGGAGGDGAPARQSLSEEEIGIARSLGLKAEEYLAGKLKARSTEE